MMSFACFTCQGHWFEQNALPNRCKSGCVSRKRQPPNHGFMSKAMTIRTFYHGHRNASKLVTKCCVSLKLRKSGMYFIKSSIWARCLLELTILQPGFEFSVPETLIRDNSVRPAVVDQKSWSTIGRLLVDPTWGRPLVDQLSTNFSGRLVRPHLGSTSSRPVVDQLFWSTTGRPNLGSTNCGQIRCSGNVWAGRDL